MYPYKILEKSALSLVKPKDSLCTIFRNRTNGMTAWDSELGGWGHQDLDFRDRQQSKSRKGPSQTLETGAQKALGGENQVHITDLTNPKQQPGLTPTPDVKAREKLNDMRQERGHHCVSREGSSGRLHSHRRSKPGPVRSASSEETSGMKQPLFSTNVIEGNQNAWDQAGQLEEKELGSMCIFLKCSRPKCFQAIFRPKRQPTGHKCIAPGYRVFRGCTYWAKYEVWLPLSKDLSYLKWRVFLKLKHPRKCSSWGT